MSKLFPQATVIHIEEVNPAANRHQPGAQEIWARAVMEHMDRHPDYVFASEDYGWKFAQSLQARFIPVDPSRDQFPISGTELRSKPFRNWHYLPDEVRPHFVRQLMIEVPGFNQKAAEEIIRKAALLLNTLYVPVYSQFYRDFADSTEHLLEDQTRSMAQMALITSLKRQARCFLLRSSLEETSMPPADCRPDLLIRLEFVGGNPPMSARDYQIPPQATAVNFTQTEHISLPCSPETAAHAIRDLAMDRYNDWF